MKNVEFWFSIEPIIGYVKKRDYETIDNLLREYIGNKYRIIKKQKFILVVIFGMYTTKNLFNILRQADYSKTYEIEMIANEREFIFNSNKYTIGLPF